VNLGLEQPWLHEFNECCTIEDVYYCFRLLLGRNPSTPEWPGHSGHAGSRLSSVVAQYLDSPEFKARQLSSFDSGDIELVNLPNFKMYVPKFDPAVGRHIYTSKTYEPPVTDILRRLLQPRNYFVDVGANMGFFSLLAAQLVGRQGHVFAFETFSQNVKLLYLSQQMNEFEQIDLFPIAVSDRSTLYLFDNAGTTGVISQLPSDFQRVMNSTIVYSVSLDKWLSNVERLDCIKIDVDGAEGLVITGALELLHRHKPYVVCEFGPDASEAIGYIPGRLFGTVTSQLRV
jgi:FkbM family methyltransferase